MSEAEGVSDIGHHGNGDVELYLESLTDLDAVMAIAEQAYQAQMGED
jgi:predicted transport protein